MKYRFIILISPLLFLLCSFSLQAQVDTRGTDFWVAFGDNWNSNSTNLQLRFVSSADCSVTLTFNATSATKTINLTAGNVYTYNITGSEYNALYTTTLDNGINNRSLRIQSTQAITLYAFNGYHGTIEATHVLPVSALGTDYWHIGYVGYIASMPDGYAVIATQDNTVVYENNTQVATLNNGQVWKYYHNNITTEITGRHITADKPVAFFSMAVAAKVPVGHGASDNLYEQLAPVNTWGKKYIVPVTVRGRDRLRVLASENGTNISQTGGTIMAVTGGQTTLTNLNAGQWVELEITGTGCYIEADKPIAVCEYILAEGYQELANTDPSIAWIPALDQKIKSALIAPFIPTVSNNLSEHYAVIMTSTDTKSNTTVKIANGTAQALSGGTWVDNVASGVSFYNMPLTNTTATYDFENPNGLTVMGLGLGLYVSYYYLSASAMRNLSPAFYVNDIHYQDLPAEVFTVHDIDFRAEIDGTMSANAGHLKWYINGAEEATAQDQLTWSKNLPNGIYQIKMTVLMDDNVSVKTIESTLTIGSPFVIEICEGASVTFTADTINGGPNPTFQWKKNRVDIPGANGLTYTLYPQNNDTITCVMVSDANCADPTIVTSHNIVVTVYGAPIPGTIGNNQSICYNTAPAALAETTAVTGGNGPYNYQWQKAGNINGTYVDITGATNPLELSPAQMGANLTQTSYYRRQVTDACGSTAYSDTITITVYDDLTGGTIGSDQSICYNTAPAALAETTAVTGGNGPYNYQWQKAGNINGTYVDITGATNPLELSPAQMGANLTQTSYYRRQVSDACGNTAYSDTITITVYDDLVGGTIGNNQIICYNIAPTALNEITPAAGGNGLYNYQWQKADNINGPYINIDEATNLLLSPIQMGANLTQTSYYRRQVTDACSTAHSDTITITVYSNLVAGTIGSNQIICYNTAPAALSEITAVAGGDGTYDYQWQKADNINGPYDNIDGATNPLELSPAQMGGNLTQTSYYRRQVSDACGTSYSDTVTITVRKRIVYPDIRILACADHVINLTKYIDIEDFQSIKWFPSSEFSNLGDNNGTLINASQFMPENTYRFTYEVTNSCGTSSGVLYLTVIKDNSVTPFVTEVRVCYEQVSELLLNTMLGIEVEGSWSFSPTVASSHLTIISTGQHTGAAIFDIEGAWNNNSIPLNGNGEKEITVTYTTLGNSCTSGKSYTLKIIITDILP